MLNPVSLGIAAVSGVVALLCLSWGRARPVRPTILFGASLTGLCFALSLIADGLAAAAAGRDTVQPMYEWIGQGFVALACLALAFTLNSMLDRFVWFGRLRDGEHSRVPNILIALARLSMYGAATTVIAAAVFHRDVTAIAATSGVVAIVLGYSLQPTLSEVFAGLALNLSRPFRMGDSIQIDGAWGVIQEANWRSVSLRTYEGTLIVMPNTKVASQRLTNMDLPNRNMRHHIRFTVDIDVPPGRVQAVGLAAMAALPHVLASPAPLLLFKDVTEHGVAYEAIFWHFDPNLYILRRDEVGAALWYAFRRAGIPFSVLRRNLTLTDHAIPVVGQPDAAEARQRLRETLQRSALFQSFPDAAIETLVERQRPLVFGPAERVVQQDAPGSSMFAILEGEAAVLLESADGHEQRIATLGVGETFGHLSLMTGAPRSATVRAIGHLVLAEIEKAALAPLLETNPAAIDVIAQEIIAIEMANQRLHQVESDTGDLANAGPNGLLDRLLGVSGHIRGFFRLRA